MIAVVIGFSFLVGSHNNSVIKRLFNTGLHPRVAAAAPTYSVGILTCTFVDHSRATPDYENATSTPGRVLRTEIRYPTLSPIKGDVESPSANPARRHGPFPLVIFGHGYDLTPDTYRLLLDHWVRGGYVVAAPLFPATNANVVTSEHNVSAGENDDVNQPLDVAYVANKLASGAQGTGPSCTKIVGLIDPNEIAATGQSDGATTVAMLLYNKTPAFRAPAVHFQAAVVLSGQEWPYGAGADPYGALAGSPPLLVVQSATDRCNPPQESTTLYNDIAMNKKWFLKINSADHLPPYVGTAPQAFAVVAKVTTNFLNMELRHERFKSGFVASSNTTPRIAHLTSGERAPGLAALTAASSTCYLGE